MTYAVSPVLGVDITATASLQSGSSTVYQPEWSAGSATLTSDGGEHIYIKAGSAITAGDVVQITMATGSAVPITTALCDAGTTTAGQLIAVSNVTLASGQYGWACRRGVPYAGISVLASCVRGSALYTTSTPGALDDTSSSSHLIAGIETTATVTGAAVAAGLCSNPVLVSGTVNNT